MGNTKSKRHKCYKPGCLIPTKNKIYCWRHKCRYQGCHRLRQTHSVCRNHICQYASRRYKCSNRMKDGACACKTHKCIVAGCPGVRLAWDSSGLGQFFCDMHQFYEKCRSKNCKNYFTDSKTKSDFCEVHRCLICKNKKVRPSGKYCQDHFNGICKICDQDAEKDQCYCTSHKLPSYDSVMNLK